MTLAPAFPFVSQRTASVSPDRAPFPHVLRQGLLSGGAYRKVKLYFSSYACAPSLVLLSHFPPRPDIRVRPNSASKSAFVVLRIPRTLPTTPPHAFPDLAAKTLSQDAEPKKGGRGKGKDPPATAEKLDSAMDSYWGNGKAAGTDADAGAGAEEVRYFSRGLVLFWEFAYRRVWTRFASVG